MRLRLVYDREVICKDNSFEEVKTPVKKWVGGLLCPPTSSLDDKTADGPVG